LLAQSAATLASLAPGRFTLGIGSSSNVIVESWNGMAFDQPYRRTRDMVRFLRAALSGDKVTESYDTFAVTGFRLDMAPPDPAVPILVAGLREGMLRLAGREADGALINWHSVDDVRRVADIVHAEGPGKEIVARVFVCPSDDTATVRAQGKRAIAAYLNVPVYRAFHEWLGRGDVLGPHWERWDAGDRAGSLDVMPDEVVDDLIIHGTPADCRAHLDRYFAAGVTSAAVRIMPFGGIDTMQAVRDLARAG
jgi:probable F420-dependent oxidoreductase